jgi:hypothetical protein
MRRTILPSAEPGAGVAAAAGKFLHASQHRGQGRTRDAVVMTAQQQFGLAGPARGGRHDHPDHRSGYAAAGLVTWTGPQGRMRRADERGRPVSLAGC